jgi:hypothetical protein
MLNGAVFSENVSRLTDFAQRSGAMLSDGLYLLAQARSRLIGEAGFENRVPTHPLYDLMGTDQNLKGLDEFIASGRHNQGYKPH